MEAFFTDIGLRIAYVLLVLGVLIALGFSIMTMVTDARGAMKSIIGTAVLLVIFIVCYATAGDEVLPKYVNYDITPGISKLIGAFINSAIVLFILGVIVGAAGSVYTMIKK
ncbi:hypothetical protein GC194_11500 [bacterium]|nr:hypothetical protein [bacterium]